jgi:hypothetical protein
MKFHWLKNVFLRAREQLGTFSPSLHIFPPPKTFVRAKLFRTNDHLCEKISRNN